MEPSIALRPGSRLGSRGEEPVPGYRLVEPVGFGGSGEVWRAEAPGGLRVALKLIRADGKLGMRELGAIRILRAIRHPNLLAYFGAWQDGNILVLGMELADCSLWDRWSVCHAQGLAGIPRGELLDALGQVARVIDFLHQPSHQLDGGACVAIHHRDIKPQNLMLLGGGVKVADFGLSTLVDQGVESPSQLGMTHAYAAPETFRGQFTNQSDQYSLAVTYIMLRGGRLPFSGPPAVVMCGHMMQPPDLSMIPEPERPILERALAKEPADRWPDCVGFLAALESCHAPGLPETIPLAEDDGEGSDPGRDRSRVPLGGMDSELPTGLLDDSWPEEVESCYGLGTSWPGVPASLESQTRTSLPAEEGQITRSPRRRRLGPIAGRATACLLITALCVWGMAHAGATAGLLSGRPHPPGRSVSRDDDASRETDLGRPRGLDSIVLAPPDPVGLGSRAPDPRRGPLPPAAVPISDEAPALLGPIGSTPERTEPSPPPALEPPARASNPGTTPPRIMPLVSARTDALRAQAGQIIRMAHEALRGECRQTDRRPGRSRGGESACPLRSGNSTSRRRSASSESPRASSSMRAGARRCRSRPREADGRGR